MSVKSTENAPHYVWGTSCDGWHLLEGSDLHIIQELVPPGACEVPHHHDRAQQFFFILSGRACIEIDGETRNLGLHQGTHVPPGKVHRFFNPHDTPVSFLVISSPTTRGDRTDHP